MVPPHREAAPARLRLLLFATAFGVFAYFHPGGGWNPNGRFAAVRSLVEGGTFALDPFLFYERGERTRLVRRTVRGPVSAGRIGIYEDWFFRLFPPGSPQAERNAFNAVEFLFQGSRLSLLPLLLAAAGIARAVRIARALG